MLNLDLQKAILITALPIMFVVMLAMATFIMG